MKTEVFEDYSAFFNRENKELNGVTAQFLADNPGADSERRNYGCWNCARCSDCVRCSDCAGCTDCAGCARCSGCARCARCVRCSDCARCARCSGCSGCTDCADCTDCAGCARCSGCSDCSCYSPQKIAAEIPKIENIHTRILEAVSKPDALNMGNWHTCDSTHCRAGWAVHMAGEAGKALEKQTSTLFAAMQIYRISSPIRVSPIRFYESNEKAMEDIRRCAQEEAAAVAKV